MDQADTSHLVTTVIKVNINFFVFPIYPDPQFRLKWRHFICLLATESISTKSRYLICLSISTKVLYSGWDERWPASDLTCWSSIFKTWVQDQGRIFLFLQFRHWGDRFFLGSGVEIFILMFFMQKYSLDSLRWKYIFMKEGV